MSQPLSDFRPQSADGAPQLPASEPAPGAINPYESPDLVEVQENQEPEPAAFSPLESQIAVLLEQGRNGAKWFYWIAGFSIVNSLIMLVSGGIYFVVGLGITSVADAIAEMNAQQAPETAILGKIVAFGFSAVVSLVVCGFGWLALQRWQPVFFLGMVLYLLDGLLFLISGELLATAFHAYVLYGMWCGFQAYRQLAVLERQLMDPLHPAGEFNPHQPSPPDVT
ncbi:MAG: hypothetical protein ACR2FY_11410 [Pirellulaceae bacterium]